MDEPPTPIQRRSVSVPMMLIVGLLLVAAIAYGIWALVTDRPCGTDPELDQQHGCR